jgi:hypothetical protein
MRRPDHAPFFRRGFRRALATMLVAAPLAVLGAAPSAHAGLLDLTCAGGETVTYEPAVTSEEQLIHVEGVQTLGPCVSLVHPTVTAGSRTYAFDVVKSCTSLFLPAGPTFTWAWTNGQTTTMQVNFVNSTVQGNVVSDGTGAVTAGTFNGDTVVMTLVGPVLDLDACNGSGITGRTGTVVLELTSVL